MDELSQYVIWEKEFKLRDEGVQAFQAIRKLDKIRDVLLSDYVNDPASAISQIRAIL